MRVLVLTALPPLFTEDPCVVVEPVFRAFTEEENLVNPLLRISDALRNTVRELIFVR